jgi:hypothetical protein
MDEMMGLRNRSGIVVDRLVADLKHHVREPKRG